MLLNRLIIYIIIIINVFVSISVEAQIKRIVQSPDGNFQAVFHQNFEENKAPRFSYEVFYKNQPIVLKSEIDVKINSLLSDIAMARPTNTRPRWFDNLVYLSENTTSKDTTWKPLFGANESIRNNYNETIITYKNEVRPDITVQFIFRASNQGIAFRYYFPENGEGTYYSIESENTEFKFPTNTKIWHTNHAQGKYAKIGVNELNEETERPLVFELANGIKGCIGEAAMIDYSRTKFKFKSENTLTTSLYDKVDAITEFGTPWRVIMTAEKETKLIENNFIFLNLNNPSNFKYTSWIQPGKIIRETTLTTKGGKACIDFAKAHNLQYILFDWKWYGPAFSFKSDARQVVIKDLDMQEVIRYGNEKGIGVWVYVNQQALLKQADQIFPLYKEWGIKGVKFGFVQVGSHRWTTWLHEMVQKCADNQLMVNIHDEYRPTGEQRFWPNLMTAEGIRGNEEFPDGTHNTVLPFTRGLVGPADYTICYYDKRLKTTHGHQLAMSVVNYSPLQTLFWYDTPSKYQGEAEIEFFEKVHTTWDETKIIDGKIGEYIITARRKGNEWFIGAINNDKAREIEITLDFLDKDKVYDGKIFYDDEKLTTKTKVAISQQKFSSTSHLKISLVPNGGTSIWLNKN